MSLDLRCGPLRPLRKTASPLQTGCPSGPQHSRPHSCTITSGSGFNLGIWGRTRRSSPLLLDEKDTPAETPWKHCVLTQPERKLAKETLIEKKFKF